MNPLNLLVLVGTRPEAVKLAPVIRVCRQRPQQVHAVVCFTGQHRELVAGPADYFELRPDANLDLMRPGQSLASLTAACLLGIDEALGRFSPDCVVAQGDTSTVMTAALAAFYRRLPFVHVEAGLRSGSLEAPWPEELNRRVAALGAALHCAPTERAARNLLAEGVPRERVHVTGNTVIDALYWTRQRELSGCAPWPAKYRWLESRPLVLVTAHRRESLGEPLARICRALRLLADKFPRAVFLYAVHLNPQVRATVHQALDGLDNLKLCQPLPYPEFVWLMDRATLLVSDSGGMQEEAAALGKPLLVLRDVTERPEALECGVAELVGTTEERIVAAASLHLAGEAPRLRPACPNPFGDGQAAPRIVDLILAQGWQR